MSCSAVDVGADVLVDGAVDMSATFAIRVDESTMIILVNIATTASRSSVPLSGATDGEADDNGGAHVHGAVNDHVSVDVDGISGTQ